MKRLVLLVFVLALGACGGAEPEPAAEPTTAAEPSPTTTAETPTTTARKPKPKPAAKALPGLPAWTAGYQEWTKITDAPLPPRDADPHLGTKTVYTSKPAAGGTFPEGTLIVKEAFRPGKDFIGLIATMRKEPGADPEHADWVFIEWTREGPNDAFSEQARDAVCWSCHMGAADRDYVFTNGG